MPLPFLKFFVSVDEKNGCRTSNNQIALNSNFLVLLRKLNRLVSYTQRFIGPILNICRLKMPNNMSSAVAHNAAPLDILTSS